MRVRTYISALLAETWLRVFTLAGFVSTTATFIPALQQAWWLKWIGLGCVVIGFVIANYNLVHHPGDDLGADVLAELRFNLRHLQTINAYTALQLRIDILHAALTKGAFTGDARTCFAELAMTIRAAKDLKNAFHGYPAF